MKRVSFLSFWLLGMLFFASPAFAQIEHIEQFDVTAQIEKDSSVLITEKIQYVFGDGTHHGIYRDIPVTYKTDIGNRSIQIAHVNVVDENGIPYKTDISNLQNQIRIRIGDANIFVSGEKTYVVSYTVLGALNYFDSHDELYWNATGLSWQVPIVRATETIVLPDNTIEALQGACYEGPNGSTESCAIATSTGQYVFTATRALGPTEGLTAALGFPKGIVTQPTKSQNILTFIKSNGVVALPILVFVFLFVWWWYKGKDPKGRGVVVAEYDSPENLTPLEQYAILHQQVSSNALSAEILYLATNGYIEITRLHEKRFFIDHTDYELKKTKDGVDLPAQSKALLDGLFVGGAGDTVKISELKNTFYIQIPVIEKATIDSIVNKKYFAQNPTMVRNWYVGLGVAFIIVIFYVAGQFSVVTLVSLLASGIVVVVFGLIMPKLTPEGAVIKEKILGLKLYMDVAEKDRINFHNAPEKNPELFEKLLPFAVVLGVEHAWAKQFEDLYTQNPGWYHDTSGGVFNPIFFTNDLHSFSTAAASALASAPRSGSGSGGGGFSGGGFGGGGGGSW